VRPGKPRRLGKMDEKEKSFRMVGEKPAAPAPPSVRRILRPL
jgi:hypothetical protein